MCRLFCGFFNLDFGASLCWFLQSNNVLLCIGWRVNTVIGNFDPLHAVLAFRGCLISFSSSVAGNRSTASVIITRNNTMKYKFISFFKSFTVFSDVHYIKFVFTTVANTR